MRLVGWVPPSLASIHSVNSNSPSHNNQKWLCSQGTESLLVKNYCSRMWSSLRKIWEEHPTNFFLILLCWVGYIVVH
jgi:hypothetical protein